MSNIVRIKARNFMSISDVEIKPGQVNQIVGRNGQGKTSILKMFEWAFRGGSDTSIIKTGEDSAEVIVELADETTIRRRINDKGNSSVEVSRAGAVYKAPQAYLNGLFATSAFNPLELLERSQRSETIMRAIDLKVTPQQIATRLDIAPEDLPASVDYSVHGLKVIDQIYNYFYSRRTEANRDVLEKAKRFEVNKSQLGPAPKGDLPSQKEIQEMISSASIQIERLTAEMATIQAANAQAEKHESILKAYRREVEKIESMLAESSARWERATHNLIVQQNHELEKLQANHEMQRATMASNARNESIALKSRIESGVAEIWKLEASPTALRPTESQEDGIRQLTSTITDYRLLAKDAELAAQWERQSVQVEEMRKELEVASAFAESLTQKVQALAGPIKRDLMATAEMPAAGLEYIDGKFSVNGISVDNLSTSESIRLAIAVARKLAMSTKVICIDGAEALDEKTFADFHKEIEDDGFTYFFTRVGEAAFVGGPTDTIIPMKDGQVQR